VRARHTPTGVSTVDAPVGERRSCSTTCRIVQPAVRSVQRATASLRVVSGGVRANTRPRARHVCQTSGWYVLSRSSARRWCALACNVSDRVRAAHRSGAARVDVTGSAWQIPSLIDLGAKVSDSVWHQLLRAVDTRRQQRGRLRDHPATRRARGWPCAPVLAAEVDGQGELQVIVRQGDNLHSPRVRETR
jgi:hypothetical protein